MRITCDIDDDLVAAARDASRRQGRPIGKVISAWARKGLKGWEAASTRNGVQLFSVREDAPQFGFDTVDDILGEE